MKALDLGMEGVCVPEEITFTTTTKPNKKMFEGYKDCVLKAAKEDKDAEVFDIKVKLLK